MPKKILIVVTHGNVGGAQVFAYNLACGLRENGHSVTVGFGEGEFLAGRLEKAGVPVVRFRNLRRTANPLTNLLFARELRRFLKKEMHDAVQFNSTNALFGAMGAKAAGARTVFTFHGLSVLDDGYEAGALVKAAYAATYRFLLRSVDASVFVSHDNLRSAERRGLAKRASVIYNGIDPATIGFLEKRDALRALERITGSSLEGKFVVGSTGRISYQKNYPLLIKACPALFAVRPDAVLVLLGDGPERSMCEELARKYGLHDRVFFCGEVDNAASYLKGIDLFALPSRYEGLSISLIETVFAGIPAIASDAAGNAEIIGKEQCFASGSETELVEIFKRTVSRIEAGTFSFDPAQKDRFGRAAMIDGYDKVL